jgi:membrane protein YqaA with SNARE-associated domain
MALAKPSKAYRYALLATVASTLGGIAGYYLGHYAYEEIAKPVLAFYGKLAVFEQWVHQPVKTQSCWCW